MSTESIWTIIACDEALDRQRELIDSGSFAEAKKIESDLKFVAEKCKSLIASRGGVLHISTLDRQVLETPVTVAADMPNIIEGFKQLFGSNMAVGMGLDLREASKAAWVSMRTNNIEMFDPEDEKFDVDMVNKSVDMDDEKFILPPNVFDPVHPKSPKPEDQPEYKNKQLSYKPGLNAQQSMQAETMLLQAIMEQLGGGQQAQQQQQQMMQQQQAQAQQPRNLAEALHGEQMPGQEGQQAQEGGQGQEQNPASAAEGQKDAEPTDDDDKDHQKLGNLLAMFNDKIPQLMGLAETNPDAFKQVLGLVHKVVDMAKKNKTAKSEVIDYTSQLEKAVSKLTGMPRGLPVGTVHKRKKKIMLDGKAVWRSVISGQVKDAKGNAISVKSSNANADGGAADIGKEEISSD